MKEGSAIFSNGSFYTGNRAKIGAVYYISNGFTYSSNNTFTNNSAISDNEFAFGGIIFCNCNSELSKHPVLWTLTITMLRTTMSIKEVSYLAETVQLETYKITIIRIMVK